jgi:hypothetical protein
MFGAPAAVFVSGGVPNVGMKSTPLLASVSLPSSMATPSRMPPIDLVTDFTPNRSSMSPHECTSWPWRTIMPLPASVAGLVGSLCTVAGTVCAKVAAVSRPACVMPTVAASTLAQPWNCGSELSSSAGQTAAAGGASLTVTATLSVPVSVPSPTVRVSV